MANSTYELWQKLSGRIVEYQDRAFVLDESIQFALFETDDGAVEKISMTLDGYKPKIGEHVTAKICYPAFRTDGSLYPYGAQGNAMLNLSGFAPHQAPVQPKARGKSSLMAFLAAALR